MRQVPMTAGAILRTATDCRKNRKTEIREEEHIYPKDKHMNNTEKATYGQ